MNRKGNKISLRMKKLKGMSKEGDEERGRMNREKGCRAGDRAERKGEQR